MAQAPRRRKPTHAKEESQGRGRGPRRGRHRRASRAPKGRMGRRSGAGAGGRHSAAQARGLSGAALQGSQAKHIHAGAAQGPGDHVDAGGDGAGGLLPGHAGHVHAGSLEHGGEGLGQGADAGGARRIGGSVAEIVLQQLWGGGGAALSRGLSRSAAAVHAQIRTPSGRRMPPSVPRPCTPRNTTTQISMPCATHYSTKPRRNSSPGQRAPNSPSHRHSRMPPGPCCSLRWTPEPPSAGRTARKRAASPPPAPGTRPEWSSCTPWQSTHTPGKRGEAGLGDVKRAWDGCLGAAEATRDRKIKRGCVYNRHTPGIHMYHAPVGFLKRVDNTGARMVPRVPPAAAPSTCEFQAGCGTVHEAFHERIAATPSSPIPSTWQ